LKQKAQISNFNHNTAKTKLTADIRPPLQGQHPDFFYQIKFVFGWTHAGSDNLAYPDAYAHELLLTAKQTSQNEPCVLLEMP